METGNAGLSGVPLEEALEQVIGENLLLSLAGEVLSLYPVLTFDMAEMYGIDGAATLEMTPAEYYHSVGYEVIGGTTESTAPESSAP